MSGPGSRATALRRLAGVAVDWLASMAVSALFFPDPAAPAGGVLRGQPAATLAVFAVSTIVLVGLLGTTIGHRLVGIRVTRVRDLARRVPPGLGAAAIRTLALCLVIPAVVWDADGRGMHDVVARTVIVRA